MPTEDVDIIEAGDRDSFEAVAIFRERYASMQWFRARVDRFDGLTLRGVAANGKSAIAVHFASCICGYIGSGPIATKEILVAAGFNDEAFIWNRVSVQRSAVFQK